MTPEPPDLKKKPHPGAPKGNANAAKPAGARRVLLQVRISAKAAELLEQNAKEYGNPGRALDYAIEQTWNACYLCGAVPKRGRGQGAELCESCFLHP